MWCGLSEKSSDKSSFLMLHNSQNISWFTLFETFYQVVYVLIYLSNIYVSLCDDHL